MCGIVGIIGNQALFRCVTTTLAQIDRGKKGNGYAWIDPTNKMWYIKAPIDALSLAVMENFFVKEKANIAIGHNRMPSKGSVSEENCHPFIDCQRRFALVHNGTLHFDDVEIANLKKKGHKILGETDSEILTHVLCEKLNNGLTMNQALEELVKKTKTQATFIILTRNGDLFATKDWMPLWLCQVKDSLKGNYSILASEKQAIETALLDLKLDKNKKQTVEYKDLDSGDLIHINRNHEVTITKHETAWHYNAQAWDNYGYGRAKTVVCWDYDPITKEWHKERRPILKGTYFL